MTRNVKIFVITSVLFNALTIRTLQAQNVLLGVNASMGSLSVEQQKAILAELHAGTNDPGNPVAAAGRRERLQQYVLEECRPAGGVGGKPCWITEWGVPNQDTSCPLHETNQITLVNETRSNFRPYIAQKRVLGLFYYAWLDAREGFAIYRCDHLTETGRLALAPF
jgi:hypothetical protein